MGSEKKSHTTYSYKYCCYTYASLWICTFIIATITRTLVGPGQVITVLLTSTVAQSTFVNVCNSINSDYFMESACVRNFLKSSSSIWNRTSERSERVRFLIQNQRVWKSRTKCFPCSNLFISYILRFLLFIRL